MLTSWRLPEQSGILKILYFPAQPLARLVLLWWSPVHLPEKIENKIPDQHLSMKSMFIIAMVLMDFYGKTL
jgi:hypothetical protein